uniref:hypothetical protein n=1 Tax=Pseudomonas syringae TaxID=317 RepID=UPI0005C9A276
ARNAHGEGGWLKELSVPRVGTVGYFCSASLDTQSSLDRYFEATNDTILPINNVEMEKLSILVEMQEQIDKLA